MKVYRLTTPSGQARLSPAYYATPELAALAAFDSIGGRDVRHGLMAVEIACEQLHAGAPRFDLVAAVEYPGQPLENRTWFIEAVPVNTRIP